ncbi:MAG TPA: hypothetical protein PKH07_05855 [bacterium]|nr:hypothetical protein [bacterium]
MKFKCPSCFKVAEFSQEEIRKIFLNCPECSRQFRPSECSPVISADKKQDKAIRRAFTSVNRELIKEALAAQKSK